MIQYLRMKDMIQYPIDIFVFNSVLYTCSQVEIATPGGVSRLDLAPPPPHLLPQADRKKGRTGRAREEEIYKKL